MVLLLLINGVMCFTLCVGVLCLSLFCYALLSAQSSFEIILKRELVVLLLLSDRCIVTINVLWLFFTVPWVGLQWMIVVFTDHTNLLFRVNCSSDELRKMKRKINAFTILLCAMRTGQ